MRELKAVFEERKQWKIHPILKKYSFAQYAVFPPGIRLQTYEFRFVANEYNPHVLVEKYIPD
jgi:hypothetical protein